MRGLLLHRGRSFIELLLRSFGTQITGVVWALGFRLCAAGSGSPLGLARFGGGLSDLLALTGNAALDVGEAPHAIGSCAAFEQGDLTQTLNQSVEED